MNTKLLILVLGVSFPLILTACSGQSAPAEASTPTGTGIPSQAPIPLPSATPNIPILELVRQNGFVPYRIEGPDDPTLSFWLPNTFVETGMQDWHAKDFLDDASERAVDYAYDIYAENISFTAIDTAKCVGNTSVSELPVEFAIRTGQDEQLSKMTVENYAGLLAIVIENMRGVDWLYDKSSERFETPGFEGWRIITDFDVSTLGYEHVTFIDYILKRDDRIWVLTFSVDTELFFEEKSCAYLLKDFDLTARSFTSSTVQVSNTKITMFTNTLIPLIRPTATITSLPSPTVPPTPQYGLYMGMDFGAWDLRFTYDEEGIKYLKLEVSIQTVDLAIHTCEISQFKDVIIPVQDSLSEPGSRVFQTGSSDAGILVNGVLYGCAEYGCSSAIVSYSIWDCGQSKQLLYMPWKGEIKVTNDH